MALSGDSAVAQALWSVAQNAPVKHQTALFEAAVVESGMRNLDHGNQDSLGVLQQRASWGPAESRMNPAESAQRFLSKAAKVDAAWLVTPGLLAQRVQVSAFPGKYDVAFPAAAAWLAYVKGVQVKSDVVGSGADPAGVVSFFSQGHGLRRLALVTVGLGCVVIGSYATFQGATGPTAAKLLGKVV